ncbi:hypothetical protein Lal_00000703 [Lupinus albus]|nr:hypothetical protein Lal_00000703 [Lupinus albus]
MSTEGEPSHAVWKNRGPEPLQGFRPTATRSHRLAQARLEQGEDPRRTCAVIGVSDVSFSVEEGEIFVLMGLSGSGKSTLIRLINRLIEPTAGDVTSPSCQGAADRPASPRHEHGLPVLRPDALAHGAGQRRLRPRSGRQEQEGARAPRHGSTGAGGPGALRPEVPHELSGGMQQRVGLARALAVDPSMIIMDEAFSALDPLKRREMQDVLLQLQKTHRRTIIFVSHDIEEAMRIGTRIGIMEGGKLVQVGTPQELIEKPANDYVRNFFDTVDTSRYLTAGQLKADSVPLYVHNGKAPDAQQVCQELQALDKHYAFIVDEDNKFRGSISLEKIALLVEEGQTRSLEPELLKHIVPVPEDLPWNRTAITAAPSARAACLAACRENDHERETGSGQLGQRCRPAPAGQLQWRLREHRRRGQRLLRADRALPHVAAGLAGDRRLRRPRAVAHRRQVRPVHRRRLRAHHGGDPRADLLLDPDQPAAGRAPGHLGGEERAGGLHHPPHPRLHADHAGVRLPDSRRHALRPRPRARDHRHGDLRHAPGGAPDQPRHPPGEQGNRRGRAILRLHQLAAAIQGAAAERDALDHGRGQPDHHDGAVDGDHRLDGRCRWPGQRRARQHPAPGHRPGLRERHGRGAAGDHSRPHHRELRYPADRFPRPPVRLVERTGQAATAMTHT